MKELKAVTTTGSFCAQSAVGLTTTEERYESFCYFLTLVYFMLCRNLICCLSNCMRKPMMAARLQRTLENSVYSLVDSCMLQYES
jgi:hypothetical protein